MVFSIYYVLVVILKSQRARIHSVFLKASFDFLIVTSWVTVSIHSAPLNVFTFSMHTYAHTMINWFIIDLESCVFGLIMKNFWGFSHFIANLINSSMVDLTKRRSSIAQRRVVTQSRDFSNQPRWGCSPRFVHLLAV